MQRILGALIIAALVVGTASGVLFLGVVGAIVSVPLALAVAILVGAPAYFLLRRLGWLSWWQVTLAGAALVLPVAVGLLPNQYFFALTVGSGLAAGLLFWTIGIRSNNSFKVTPDGAPQFNR